MRRALPRGAATVAASWALRQACTAAVVSATFAALLPLFVPITDVSLWVWLSLFLLGVLLLFLELGLRIYLGVVSTVAAVTAAAKPGRFVARAWRLMRGRRVRAVVYVAATSAIWAARLTVEWPEILICSPRSFPDGRSDRAPFSFSFLFLASSA